MECIECSWKLAKKGLAANCTVLLCTVALECSLELEHCIAVVPLLTVRV